jgi:hypothetical protein
MKMKSRRCDVLLEVPGRAWLGRLATQICRSIVYPFDQSNVVLASEADSQDGTQMSWKARRW